MNDLEELEKLNDLKQKGILSDKEFEIAKKNILQNRTQLPQSASAQPQIIIQNSNSAKAVAGNEKGKYSVFIAFVLCLFGGWLGLHRFYTGYYFSGFIYLISFGFFGIGWLWDLISIFFGFYRDPEGRTLG